MDSPAFNKCREVHDGLRLQFDKNTVEQRAVCDIAHD